MKKRDIQPGFFGVHADTVGGVNYDTAASTDIARIISGQIGTHVAVVTIGGDVTGNNKRSESTGEPELVSWSTPGEGFIRTTIASYPLLNRTISVYNDYINNGSTLYTRDEYNGYGDTWLSFNTYGMEGDYVDDAIQDMYTVVGEQSETVGYWIAQEKQYPSGLEEIDVYDKFCLSLGKTYAPGLESIIVGEVYIEAYGGIDTICQGG